MVGLERDVAAVGNGAVCAGGHADGHARELVVVGGGGLAEGGVAVHREVVEHRLRRAQAHARVNDDLFLGGCLIDLLFLGNAGYEDVFEFGAVHVARYGATRVCQRRCVSVRAGGLRARICVTWECPQQA